MSVSNKSPLFPEANIINAEGRFIRVELQSLVIVHVYVPNSGRGEEGYLAQRVEFEEEIRFILGKETKPLVYCGDMNVVAARPDIWDWNSNLGQPGMTEEERTELGKLCETC